MAKTFCYTLRQTLGEIPFQTCAFYVVLEKAIYIVVRKIFSYSFFSIGDYRIKTIIDDVAFDVGKHHAE